MAQEPDVSLDPEQQAQERREAHPQLREVARLQPVPRLKTSLRRAFFHTWRVLPLWSQRLAVRVAAPKVTMGACAVILDGRGRVLLAHHTYRAHPWGLPGGLVSPREQPSAGLARELREELGVQAQVGPVLSAETNAATHQIILYYRATLLGTPHEDGVEIDGFRYAAPEEVPTLLGNDAGICLQCMQPPGN